MYHQAAALGAEIKECAQDTAGRGKKQGIEAGTNISVY